MVEAWPVNTNPRSAGLWRVERLDVRNVGHKSSCVRERLGLEIKFNNHIIQFKKSEVHAFLLGSHTHGLSIRWTHLRFSINYLEHKTGEPQ